MAILKSPSFNFPRDYLVPMPSPDGWHAIPQKAEYEDAIGLSRSLLSHLKVPLWDSDCDSFVNSNDPLLYSGVSAYWWEHSERHFLSGKAAELGIPPEQLDFLGRWMPKPSDAYLLTARASVWEVQEKIIERFRHDPQRIDESEAFHKLEVYMVSKSYPRHMVDAQLARLRLPVAFFADG
jgi:hypothetical protein